MMVHRRHLLSGAAALGALCLVRPGAAQDFPARPLQGTIQWGAGGSTDAVTRAVAPIVEEKLGQKLVLTNRPGGTGVIGMQYVHSQRADGYNILFGAENPMLYGVLGLSELSYDDFYPLVLLARGTPVLVARKDAPWADAKALIDHVKAHPDTVKMGATGVGGLPFVVHAMLAAEVPGFKVTQVPFDGDGPALTALEGGHVDFMAAVWGAARERIRAGRIKALAAIATERIEGLDAPPITETLPGFKKYLPWGPFFGAFVKKETPGPIVEKLEKAFVEAANDPRFKEFCANFGVVPMGVSGEEARKFMNRWRSITAWLLADVGAAKNDPAKLGIPRL
ncbi:MAG: tripartite tricarboxylate transporter substrate binding protein [Geminicoccaceae bacterium]|nr:tripartite tricarboxylate transporter substrate binding protein [Geminicoccaceae bacterium]